MTDETSRSREKDDELKTDDVERRSNLRRDLWGMRWETKERAFRLKIKRVMWLKRKSNLWVWSTEGRTEQGERRETNTEQRERRTRKDNEGQTEDNSLFINETQQSTPVRALALNRVYICDVNKTTKNLSGLSRTTLNVTLQLAFLFGV